MKYIPLHIHSEYSLSDSILRIADIVNYAKDNKLECITITDLNNSFAQLKLYNKARAKGIKPILGCDLTIKDEFGNFSQLVLLAKNKLGWENLNLLITTAYDTDQTEGKVFINKERLNPNSVEGIIALSGGMRGDIFQALVADDEELAQNCVQHWVNVFGADNFYLELTRLGIEGEKLCEDYAKIFCEELGICAVATNFACFLTEEDYPFHEARVCIAEGSIIDDPDRKIKYQPSYYLKSPEEMAELFADCPELLENSYLIAQRCNVELTLGKNYLPDFPTPNGEKIEDYLEIKAREGLVKRMEENFPNPAEREAKFAEYNDRLNMELGVIKHMGFSGYFMIVADFINWAKENDIPVGPGRGSGAGSLVAYSLGITNLDPLLYDLLFERFLNPERISMPDFDVDFCMDRRDEVISYVANKYGFNNVAQIATHGTMAAKAVIRDVGRVLGLPYSLCDHISKLVPKVLDITLSDALGRTAKSQENLELYSPELAEEYNSNPEIKELIDYSLKLEGLTRSVGKHAAGIVIAPTKMSEFSSIYAEDASAPLVTQFDKDDIEAIGLVKFDFLGLRNLTIIDWAVKDINKKLAKKGKKLLNMEEINLNDKKTFDLIKSGKTSAVFQLENQGIKATTKKLKPDNIEEITALLALYRPGPLNGGMVDDFINCKHGLADVSYPHPLLEPILKATFGVMVYQEQVMQTAQVLAGYSLGGADLLRRAMGKKKKEVMEQQKAIFIEGAVKQGIDKDKAKEVFELMEKFAEYGFNKSHSAAYAVVCYQTAWLKAHYPTEFFNAVLNADMDKTDKVVAMVNDAKDFGVEILPPSINRSDFRFCVDEKGKILFGLGAIKGVGEANIRDLIAERQKGNFKSLLDLCRRVDLKKINKATLETLIRAGAFDEIEPNRGALMAALPQISKIAAEHQAAEKSAQRDMFGFLRDDKSSENLVKLDYSKAWEHKTKLEEEKKALGMYLTDHPINPIKAQLNALCGRELADMAFLFNENQKEEEGRKEEGVMVGGIITDIRAKIVQKGKNKGSELLFITIEDRSASLEFIVGNEVYKDRREIFVKDNILILVGDIFWHKYKQNWTFAVKKTFIFEDLRFSKLSSLSCSINEEDFLNAKDEIIAFLKSIQKEGGRQKLNIRAKNPKKGYVGSYSPLSCELDADSYKKLENYFRLSKFIYD